MEGAIKYYPREELNAELLRVTRLITDKLSLALGYNTIFGAFPRSDKSTRQVYFDNINECAKDANYAMFCNWIRKRLMQNVA